MESVGRTVARSLRSHTLSCSACVAMTYSVSHILSASTFVFVTTIPQGLRRMCVQAQKMIGDLSLLRIRRLCILHIESRLNAIVLPKTSIIELHKCENGLTQYICKRRKTNRYNILLTSYVNVFYYSYTLHYSIQIDMKTSNMLTVATLLDPVTMF